MQPAWRETMNQPVDPEVFLEMCDLWHEAANKPLRPPGSTPPVRGEGQDGGPVLILSDIPENRSGMAVTGALRKRNIDSLPYTLRLMHLYQLGTEQRLGKFFTTSENGSRGVDEVLLRAAAMARFVVLSEHVGFDMDDVLAHAEQLKAAEDQA